MSNETFKPGDIVTLKSGGPAMTVAWVDAREAYCEWFDDNKVTGAKFPFTSLEE